MKRGEDFTEERGEEKSAVGETDQRICGGGVSICIRLKAKDASFLRGG